MANIDIPIYDYLRDIKEGPEKVAIEHLYDLVRQTRTRTGGDSDNVAASVSASSTNFYAAALLEPPCGSPSFEDSPGNENFSLFHSLEGMDVAGEKSTLNSTTSTLGIGATFTGTAEQNDYGYVFASVYSDVAGTLHLDFSTDESTPTNWDSSFSFDVAAGSNEVQPMLKGGRWFRARFVNGGIGQTAFRMGVYFLDQIGFVSSPMNSITSLDSAAVRTSSPMPWLQYARGLFGGVTGIKKFGRNSAVGTSFVPVTMGGVYQTPQAASATTVRIKAGGDANDTAAGTGAREVTVEGLDETFAFVSEAIATAGASASSATTATFTRIFRVYVSGSGTYATASAGSHSGDIVIENGAGGTDWATIDATDITKAQSEIGVYTVPAGSSGYVKLREVSIDSGKTIDLDFFSRTGCDETAAPYSARRTQSVMTGLSGGSIETFGPTDIPFGPYVGPTDIGFLAKVTTGTASVSVEFDIFLVEE